MGYRVPSIRLRDNLQLPSDTYRIKIYGVTAGLGQLQIDKLLALPPEGTTEIEVYGDETLDPAFGVPAVWVAPESQIDAEIKGYTIAEPEAVLITHLGEIISQSGWKLLDRQSVQELIDHVKAEFPAVVEEVVPSQISIGVVQRVLQNLLRESIPVSNITMILESLADNAPRTKDAMVLTEMVRHTLAEEIHELFVEPDGTVYAASFDPSLENYLQKSVGQTDGTFQIPPQTLSTIMQNLRASLDQMKAEGHDELLIVSPAIRAKLRELLEPIFPELSVISYAELPMRSQLHSKWVVSNKAQQRGQLK
jgi:flagellar biosynthesis protein FlhA